jgi:prolipoprotein diacylglyceryltransferase
MLHSLSGTLPHQILEIAAYAIGGRLYWQQARAYPQPAQIDRLLILGAAIFGAFLGSKLLHVAEHLPYLLQHRSDVKLWIGGKSVLGGFIGGTWAVEIAKWVVGWRRSTGDAWLPALPIGLMIGRLGCQLSGVWDQTYGIPTNLPWAWDYGDGIGRHPTGLYEILLIALLSWGITRIPKGDGRRFSAFMAGYCLIRLGVEFFKPPYGSAALDTLPVASYAGITAIQWAAVVGAIYFSIRIYQQAYKQEH